MGKENHLKNLQQDFANRMDYDELLNCMRCGFCQPSCPTFAQTNRNEAASPRGRIALIKGVVDGIIEPDADFEEQLDLCLGCRACEPVCPPGVNYGHLLEEARDIINQRKKHSLPVKVLRHAVFKELFPHPSRMKKLHYLLWFYQKSGVQKAMHTTRVINLLPGNLATMDKILPDIPSPKELNNRPKRIQVAQKKKRVSFFSGCLMDTMFMKTNDSTLKLLEAAGCEIVIPDNQNCCGALHGHSGEKQSASELAMQNIAAFEKLEVDYIVLNAGGCGAFLVDYGHLLKNDPTWSKRAKDFSNKVKDFTEILVELEFHKKELTLPPQRVTYQDSCHLRNVMKTAAAPRTLLKAIKGIEYVEMKESDQCCGSAGIYNIVQEEMSMKILDHKMNYVKEASPAVIVTANPGCLLQMKLGIERENVAQNMRATHIADLLLESMDSQNKVTEVSL